VPALRKSKEGRLFSQKKEQTHMKVHFFFKRFTQRERESQSGGGEEGERIPSRLSAEHGASHGARNYDPKIMT